MRYDCRPSEPLQNSAAPPLYIGRPPQSPPQTWTHPNPKAGRAITSHPHAHRNRGSHKCPRQVSWIKVHLRRHHNPILTTRSCHHTPKSQKREVPQKTEREKIAPPPAGTHSAISPASTPDTNTATPSYPSYPSPSPPGYPKKSNSPPPKAILTQPDIAKSETHLILVHKYAAATVRLRRTFFLVQG